MIFFISKATPRFIHLIVTLNLITISLFAQYESEDEHSASFTSKYNNLNESSVPAFIMLDVTANKIAQAGYTRSVKIDWTLKNYKNTPNVGLELQPIWLLFYNRGDLHKYRRTTDFMRMLSTLSISVGTYNAEFWRQVAYAAKISLYNADDPLMDTRLDDAIGEYQDNKYKYKLQIESLRSKLRKEKNSVVAYELKREIYNYKDSLFEVEQKQIEINRIYKEEYRSEYWNAPAVDFAIGKLKIYDVESVRDSSKQIISGYGAWITASKGLGYRTLLSAMVKYQMLDTETSKILAGLNFRYGNPRYNIYTEYAYDFANNYVLSSGRSTDKSSLGIGGDFKINSLIQLNLGLTMYLDQKFKYVSMLPAANIICLMNL